MTALMITRVIFRLLLIALICYAVYREDDLIRFERKVWKYIKAFFKALYYTAKDKVIK